MEGSLSSALKYKTEKNKLGRIRITAKTGPGCRSLTQISLFLWCPKEPIKHQRG